MADIEKIIRGLKCCLMADCTMNCPYATIPVCSENLMKDTLALLKEQEPVEPVHPKNADEPWFRCGSCGQWVDNTSFRYCPWCGRKVKWNGMD